MYILQHAPKENGYAYTYSPLSHDIAEVVNITGPREEGPLEARVSITLSLLHG